MVLLFLLFTDCYLFCLVWIWWWRLVGVDLRLLVHRLLLLLVHLLLLLTGLFGVGGILDLVVRLLLILLLLRLLVHLLLLGLLVVLLLRLLVLLLLGHRLSLSDERIVIEVVRHIKL